MFGSGIKKELKLFTRGFRFIGLIAVIVGVALSYPLLYKMMEVMVAQLGEMAGEMGGEMTEATGSLTAMMDSLKAMYGGSLANVGFYTAVSGVMNEGVLVAMLLLMATAGGEQKKRSVIIPNCAGLTPAGYVLPKFVIYPVVTAAFAFGGSLIAALVSNLVFDNSIVMENALFSSACAAGYVLFITSVYFMFGLCTGRPGIGVLVMFLGASLVPIILEIFSINKYTPFALSGMIMTPYSQADMNAFVLSLTVSVIISVICCFVSLIVTTLRKIDNKGAVSNL